MTILAGDILRTTCNFVLPNGVEYQNVFHHKRTGIGVLSDQFHVDTIETWVEVMYNELADEVFSTTATALSSVDLVEWVVDKWLVVENIGTFAPSITFVGAGEICPNQVSPFVIFKTARPKTVGRKFLFPTMEPDQNQGIIDAPTIAAIVAWADDAVNDITLQVLDYLVPGVPRTGVNSWQEFTLAVVTNLLGTQRRRRPGYGA